MCVGDGSQVEAQSDQHRLHHTAKLLRVLQGAGAMESHTLIGVDA